MSDFDFKGKVLDSTRPVVVQFTAPWCGPCRMMKPQIQLVERERGDFLFITVDVDQNPKISMIYGVRSIPHVVLFQNGQITSRYAAPASKAILHKWLDEMIGPLNVQA